MSLDVSFLNITQKFGHSLFIQGSQVSLIKVFCELLSIKIKQSALFVFRITNPRIESIELLITFICNSAHKFNLSITKSLQERESSLESL